MEYRKLLFLCVLVGFLSGTLDASQEKRPVATASISHRASKPGQRFELLISVRNAQPPVSALPECPSGLELRSFRKPQLLAVEGGDVWLLRFRLIANAVGDYEIPPIRVSVATGSVFTKPIILHVSNDAKPPLPDARELALTTDIPLGLAQEAVKTFPTPAPKTSPSPAPKDGRPLPSRLVSSIAHGFIRFWNYPGK